MTAEIPQAEGAESGQSSTDYEAMLAEAQAKRGDVLKGVGAPGRLDEAAAREMGDQVSGFMDRGITSEQRGVEKRAQEQAAIDAGDSAKADIVKQSARDAELDAEDDFRGARSVANQQHADNLRRQKG